MRTSSILGLLLVLTLFWGCFPQRLIEENTYNRNAQVWASDNSSIKVSGRFGINRPPNTMRDRAGWIRFKLRIINPNQHLRFLSEEINIYCLNSDSDIRILVPIEENTINIVGLQTSKKSSFYVSGRITIEIFDSNVGLDEFEVHFPDILYHQDTISLDPIKFFTSH